MSSTTFDRNAKINEAKKHLRAHKADEEKKLDKQEVLALAKEFQKNSIFSYARRLYQLLHKQSSLDSSITMELAICTYKDTDLASDIKYDAAANLILKTFKVKGEDDSKNKILDAHALGILGSIYKKKWQYENHDGHLYQSLEYYLEGYNIALKVLEKTPSQKKAISDFGYCGINTAFVYDLLAQLDSFRNGKKRELSIANNFSEEADKYRAKIIEKFTTPDPESGKIIINELFKNDEEKRYWLIITLAEAYLGRDDFDNAAKYYQEAFGEGNTTYWKRHSACIQAFKLLELHHDFNSENLKSGRKAVENLIKDKAISNIDQIKNEKIGLALSGGGFRASLFHIGVLAQLAEKGILHKVEVISCVSGGSIIGAYYYLKLKFLLEDKEEKDLTKKDYIDLVKSLEEDFLEGINKNIRLNIFTNFASIFKIAFFKRYSRTDRTAELYDKYLYRGLIETNNELDIMMSDLLIKPAGQTNFHPVNDNWQREYKVPNLVINATTLNTGHSWQFTATWMGESPAYLYSEFDALPNLRRMYYAEAPKEHQNIELSKAVAASACVPGLFSPIVLANLYKNYPKVLLIDGGVHDNQGISTLYEQECNNLIISDASGQMSEHKKPSDFIPSVVSRTNSILQERIRNIQFLDLKSRKKSGVIRDYLLMHFTKGLEGKVIDWEGCDDPYIPPVLQEDKDEKFDTAYNIRKKIQQSLARIRTDLDTFHKTEAYSLMYSGFKMTAHEIKLSQSQAFNNNVDVSDNLQPSSLWDFMKIQAIHDDNVTRKELHQKLIPSAKLVGKLYLLSKKLRAAIRTFLFLLLATLYLVAEFHCYPNACLYLKIAPCFLLGLIIIVVERGMSKLLGIRSFIGSVLLFIFLLLIWLPLNVLRFTNRLYLNMGKLPKL